MPSADLNKTQIRELGLHTLVNNEEKQFLRGLAEIAAYMDCSISAVRRYIKDNGLPAFSPGCGKEYTVSKAMIHAWIAQSHLRRSEEQGWNSG